MLTVVLRHTCKINSYLQVRVLCFCFPFLDPFGSGSRKWRKQEKRKIVLDLEAKLHLNSYFGFCRGCFGGLCNKPFLFINVFHFVTFALGSYCDKDYVFRAISCFSDNLVLFKLVKVCFANRIEQEKVQSVKVSLHHVYHVCQVRDKAPNPVGASS